MFRRKVKVNVELYPETIETYKSLYGICYKRKMAKIVDNAIKDEEFMKRVLTSMEKEVLSSRKVIVCCNKKEPHNNV